MSIFKTKYREESQVSFWKIDTVILLFKQLRPKQWTKNLLVFAALIFSMEFLNITNVWMSVGGFTIFCLVSSSVYILNDFMDIEADSQHPTKKYRPMASGMLNPTIAVTFGGLSLAFSLITSFIMNPLFTLILVLYFTINILYSIKLKHIVIIDLMVIASGFVLRAVAGGVVIDVPLTPWFLICIMLLSLFLATSKRRHEVILLEEGRGSHRKVLENYSVGLLDQLNTIVISATIMSYSLFTFTSNNTSQLMWTIPFVLYGIFRYLYLIQIEGKGGSPEKVLLEDRHILITVVLYVISVILILIIFNS